MINKCTYQLISDFINCNVIIFDSISLQHAKKESVVHYKMHIS